MSTATDPRMTHPVDRPSRLDALRAEVGWLWVGFLAACGWGVWATWFQ